MRVGVETTFSSVTHSSTSVTATYAVYTQNQYTWTSDSQTLSYTGSGGGQSSTTFTNNDTSTAQLRATKTYTYNYTTYGSSPGSRTFTATISGASNGVTPYVSVSWAIPARPYGLPAAVTALTGDRTSDVLAQLTWTLHSTTGEPYDTISVTYKRIGYDSDYLTPANTVGSAYSVSVTTQANYRYSFRVRANNSIGSSDWAYQTDEDVLTSPGAPTYLGTWYVSGSGVMLYWDNTVRYSTSCFRWRIQRSVSGGAYSTVVEGLSGSTTYWTDTSPSAGVVIYRIQAYTVLSAGAGGYGPANLTSAWTSAAAIGSASAPYAPTGLSPSGVPVDAALSNTLTWVHNHSGDYATQTYYQVRYSSNGGSSWTTLSETASTTSSHTLAGGTLTNGNTYVWQVRTRGNTAAAWGPFSASATITTTSTPTVTINAGEPDAITTDPFIYLGWAYAQAQSSAQAQWQAVLIYTSNIIEVLTGTSETSTTFATSPIAGETYTVGVRAQSAAGLWSSWATFDTEIILLPPAAVTLTCMYDPVSGSMSIEATSEDPEVGVTEAIESVSVMRQVNGVGDWLPVAEPLDGGDGVVIDPLPATSVPNGYHAIVTGINGANIVSDEITCNPQDCEWVRVNFGPNLTTVVRCNGAPEVSADTSRLRAAVHYLGRQWPSLLVGDPITQKISFKGVLHFDPDCDDCTPRDGATSTAWEWENMSQIADAIMFRDHEGRRVVGALESVQVSVTRPGIADLSLSLTTLDPDLERVLTGFPDFSD